jgi:tetrahydromethanopterin S-methyltransferase subunit G
MEENEEDWEKRWEEFEKRWEEWAEELSKRIGLAVEKAMRGAFRGAMLGPRAIVAVGPKLLDEQDWLRRPIPIRNLSRSLYSRIREIAERRGIKVGEVMNEAMRFYLSRYDEATLEREKERILRKIEEIGAPGYAEPEVRDLLLKEYQEMLNEVKKRLSELRSKGEEKGTT